MVRMVQKDVYILIVIYHCKVGIMLCILDTLVVAISSGAMKLPFSSISSSQAQSFDKSKSKYEWSEWSKRTYTYYIGSYHCKVGIMLCILDTLVACILAEP